MRLIDADALIEKMRSEWDMQDLYLPIHFVELLADEVPTAYDVDKVVEEIENMNTTWKCQECIHLETCDKIQMEKGSGSEHLDLCAEVVKVLSKEIVRKGGVK